jgi:hypothetical protein
MYQYFKVEFTIQGETKIKEINVQAKSKNDIKSILLIEGQIEEIKSIILLNYKPNNYIG